MKALKLYTSILITICLFVLSACKDNITSSLSSEPLEIQKTLSVDKKRGDTYSSSHTLKSGEYVFLHNGITSLKFIKEYSISNCVISKIDLHVTASNIDGVHSLPCSSSQYFLYDLMIENRSNEVITISVKLTGIPNN